MNNKTTINISASVFCALAVLLPPMSIYAPKGITVLLILAGNVLLFDPLTRAKVWPIKSPILLLAIIFLLFWAVFILSPWI